MSATHLALAVLSRRDVDHHVSGDLGGRRDRAVARLPVWLALQEARDRSGSELLAQPINGCAIEAHATRRESAPAPVEPPRRPRIVAGPGQVVRIAESRLILAQAQQPCGPRRGRKRLWRMRRAPSQGGSARTIRSSASSVAPAAKAASSSFRSPSRSDRVQCGKGCKGKELRPVL